MAKRKLLAKYTDIPKYLKKKEESKQKSEKKLTIKFTPIDDESDENSIWPRFGFNPFEDTTGMWPKGK